MAHIIQLIERDYDTAARLLSIWQTSVQATHTFLTEADIIAIEPEVQQGVEQIELLFCCIDDNNIIQGFVGIEDEKVEMLFVDAEARGKGIGKQLLSYAINNCEVKYVDVNEQNDQACGFYMHSGFKVIGRSALDSQGRAFPILHLALEHEKNFNYATELS